MDPQIGLFCDSFPPIMDGVAVCMQNYAHWMQKKVGNVTVVTPHKNNAHYKDYDFSVLDFMSVPVPGGHMYLNDVIIVTAAILLDPFYAFLVGGVGAGLLGRALDFID